MSGALHDAASRLETDGSDSLSVTQTLIERARAKQWNALPPDVVTQARHCLVDWVGVSLAGSSAEVSRIVSTYVGELESRGSSTVVGQTFQSSAREAALANGTAGHALDFDDVLLASSGHVTAVVMPAVLAVGEQVDARGDQLLTAFVSGFETVGDLGAAMSQPHYARGFHATSTLGAFGAVAGASWLWDLNTTQWQNAFGLAATTAAGLKSMFGTMAKPLHAGWAAQAGVTAADLARRGLSAGHDAIDSPQGFVDAHGTPLGSVTFMSAEQHDWNLRRNLFKFHAACFLTHSGIDSARILRDRHELVPDNVRQVTVSVNPGHLAVCNIVWPSTGAESKFSLRYAVAAALTPGVELSTAFTDSAVQRFDREVLAARIDIVPDPTLPRERSRVDVVTADGTHLTASIDASAALNSPNLLSRERDLASKFLSLATPALGAERATEACEFILSVDETTSVRELASFLRPTESNCFVFGDFAQRGVK